MAILDENGERLSPLDEMMDYGNGGTVLDRLADGYEGLHPAEFRLRGMSEAGQRLFASDVAKRIARRAKRKSVDIDPNILEQKIMNMPEDVRDSWLISADGSRIKMDDNFFEPSNFSSQTNEITIRPRILGNDENSVIHEVFHHSDNNMKRRKRKFVGKNGKGEKILAKAKESELGKFGKTIEEFLQKSVPIEQFKNPVGPYYDGNAVFNFVENFVKDKFPGANEKERLDIVADFMDMYEMSPFFPGFSGEDGMYKKFGHGKSYRDSHLRMSRNLYDAEDFADDEYKKLDKENFKLSTLGLENPNRKKLLDMWNELSEKANMSAVYSPLSSEGFAEIGEIVSYPDGMRFFESDDARPVLDNFVKLFRNDKRKQRFVPPDERYADEEGLRLIEERNRKKAERRARAEDRYRASFMGLPDDKRAYYENANPGDPLFIRDPSIPDSRAFFVKGDPRVLFRGDKMIQFNRNPNGTFWRRPMEYDLNQLSPEDVNVPMDDFERELYEYERDKALNSKGRNK